MNTLNIIGRLTRDIEIKNTANQKVIGKSGLALNDSFNKEKTHFFNFTCFGKTAEIMAQYLKKGDQVALVGSISHNTWTDKEGTKKSSVEIMVNSFTFVGGKKSDSTPQNNPQATQIPTIQFDESQEVPF